MISLRNIIKNFKIDGQEFEVLKSVNLEVYENDFLAIMGPSGSGKSTLLNLLGFVDRKYQGEYYLDNQPMMTKNDGDLSQLRNNQVGFVFQQFNLIETLTVEQNIELPLLYAGYAYGETKDKVQSLLDKMGIGDKGPKFPKQLSGGQQQRAAICRAIINNPRFILADEPTGALDTQTSNEIMTVFQELNKEGVTIILVTHDPETVSYCNRVVRMVDGELVEEVRDGDET